MLNFLKLIRIQNLLIIFVTMYLTRYCILIPIIELNEIAKGFTDLQFFLLVLGTVLIAGGGYAINDYFDAKIDFINKPEKTLVGIKIKRRVAMATQIAFNILGIVIGVYLSYIIKGYSLLFLFMMSILALGLYSFYLKRRLFIGNFTIALLTGLIPLAAVFYETKIITQQNFETFIEYNFDLNIVLSYALGYSMFAFLTNLAREIIKDIEDIKGDNELGRLTIPIVLGVKKAKIIITSILFFIIALLGFINLQQYQYKEIESFIYFVVFVQLPMFYLIYHLWKSDSPKDYSSTGNILKFIMLFGILSMLVFKYTL
jgi:4-hydroxybenzoate polyprenyltransferase